MSVIRFKGWSVHACSRCVELFDTTDRSDDGRRRLSTHWCRFNGVTPSLYQVHVQRPAAALHSSAVRFLEHGGCLGPNPTPATALTLPLSVLARPGGGAVDRSRPGPAGVPTPLLGRPLPLQERIRRHVCGVGAVHAHFPLRGDTAALGPPTRLGMFHAVFPATEDGASHTSVLGSLRRVGPLGLNQDLLGRRSKFRSRHDRRLAPYVATKKVIPYPLPPLFPLLVLLCLSLSLSLFLSLFSALVFFGCLKKAAFGQGRDFTVYAES
jgi:hypothetical protein